MAEYIEREGVKKSINFLFDIRLNVAHEIKQLVLDLIDDERAADVQPVKRGHWQITMMSEATGWDLSVTGGHDEVCEYQCSVCGKSNILDEFGESFLPPYCPFCGAKMENHETIKG